MRLIRSQLALSELASSLIAALIFCAASSAVAEPIRLIVPTAAGGGTDGFFRVLAKEATPFFKDPLVVINTPGAGGTIGVAQMVHAAPDGQTLAAVWLGPVTVSPHTMHVSYTPNDYIPVIQLTSAPYVFCGKGFIEELRKNPDKYTYGDDGAGGPGQLAAERIFRSMKVTARDIPYKGAGETLLGFLGKQIDIYVGSVPPILQYAQSGKANCLLLSSAERIASLPSASGLRDLGIAEDETILWRAVLAPKGTPAAKIAELEAGFEKAANQPATRKFLDDAGEQLLIRKGPALRQYIDKEYEALGKLIKTLNLTPQ